MAISALTGIGLALSAVGTFVQLAGQMAQTAAMKKAENAREQQMNLDVNRRNRDAIRQGIVARSQAEFAAFSQGAQGGSGLEGGLAQVTGDVGRAVTGNEQNRGLGSQIFQANRDYYSASGLTSLGVGLSSFGNTFMSNAGVFNRVGGGAFA